MIIMCDKYIYYVRFEVHTMLRVLHETLVRGTVKGSVSRFI